MHTVPGQQAVTAQPACPHARWQWGLRSAQGPGCSAGCRDPEPRNEPFRTRLWVPGGSRPPRKLLSAHPLHASPQPSPIPEPFPLSPLPSHLLQDNFSKPQSPLLLPYSSYRKPPAQQTALLHSFLAASYPGSQLFRGKCPGLHSFHISHSTAISELNR